MNYSQISFCGKLAAIFFAASCFNYSIAQEPYAQWVTGYETSYSWGMDGCADIYGNYYSTGYFDDTLFVHSISGEDTLVQTGTQFDCLIQKIDSEGNLIWAKAIHNTGQVLGHAITTDSLGFIYVAGAFNGTADFDPGTDEVNKTTAAVSEIFVLKLNSNGDFIWVKTMEGNSVPPFGSIPNVIRLDAQNNLLLTGKFAGTVDFDPDGVVTNFKSTAAGAIDLFIQKLDTAGNLQWIQTITAQEGKSLDSDSDGNICVVGGYIGTVDFDPGIGVEERTSTNLSFTDSFVLKLDANGNFVWVNTFGGMQANYGADVCIDSGGNVYAIGVFKGIVDFDPDPSDTFNVSASGSQNTYIQKTDLNGNFLWVKALTSEPSGSNYNVPKGAALDNLANIYVCGYYEGTMHLFTNSGSTSHTDAGFSDLFLQKIDSSGGFIWGAAIGDISGDLAEDIFIDSDNSILVTGKASKTVNFNPYSNPHLFTTANASIFLAKYKEGYVNLPEQTNTEPLTLRIYPNPAEQIQFLSLVLEQSSNGKIQLLDLTGRVVIPVYNGPFSNGETVYKVDVDNLPSGIYIYRITFHDGTMIHQKTIKH